MTSLNPSLRLALLQKAKGKKNILQKGFTLVELMTVIVIVGVLSAVALPSFMSQSAKAKGTEATTQITSVIKDASSVHQQDTTKGVPLVMGEPDASAGTAATVNPATEGCEMFGAPEDADATNKLKTKFDYDCLYTRVDTAANDDPTLRVIATGNTNDDQIKNTKIEMWVNLDTGTVERDLAKTSKMFGGRLANPS